MNAKDFFDFCIGLFGVSMIIIIYFGIPVLLTLFIQKVILQIQISIIGYMILYIICFLINAFVMTTIFNYYIMGGNNG